MDRGIDVRLINPDKAFHEASQKWLVGVAAKWRSRLRAMKAVNTGNLLRSIKPVVITAPEALTASLQFPFYGLPLHYGTHIIGVTKKAKKNVGKSSRTYFYGERPSRKGKSSYSHRYSKRYSQREIEERPFMEGFRLDGSRLVNKLLRLAKELGEEQIVFHFGGIDDRYQLRNKLFTPLPLLSGLEKSIG